MERKQLETDIKIERIFSALESKPIEPDKGIFYDGQIFDAYTFVADLVRKAKNSLVLVDNYVDDTVLHLFTKRKTGNASPVTATEPSLSEQPFHP